MDERSSRFRVYRVVEAVPHVNLFDTDGTRLYTTYQQGYGERQPAIDGLETGDLIEGTVAGDPTDEEEAWTLREFDRVGGVDMGFATDVELPEIARETWDEQTSGPAHSVIEADGQPVGECWVQPRAPLPGGSFVPSVLAGLLPMEPKLTTVASADAPTTDAVFLDPDPVDAASFSQPYGVLLLFSERADETRRRYRERFDCPRGVDSRPDYDPYELSSGGFGP
ncbi:hypothetical protein IL252_05105 [Halomicrobium sp. IBSBa]|uniref:Uncharacterized protein n=1 Tax=Halomicrobium mukohataei TaxID=57705 RepID=A0A847U865_9EURY|nr:MULTISPECIES: hypothetical protein [Halomicrobium]MBO4247197.1 hypothetical protein [Halomicrobium sp. IBSBa]NLV08487.1 hypothetical protein [Halomicrobium mukohataei]